MGIRSRFRNFRIRVRNRLRERAIPISVITLILLFLLVYFWPYIFVSIYPGQRGVLWSRFFGTVVEKPPYTEGLVFVLPWNKIYVYNVRFQHISRQITVLSRDGLHIDVEIAIRFEPHEQELGRLHQEVGPDYVNVIIIPEIEAAVRDVIGQFRPEELYTLNRRQIQAQITERAHLESVERWVRIDDVLLKAITLPEVVRSAILNKLAQEQLMLEYDYRIQTAEKEAERKRKEAEGIRDFQEIVAREISEKYLRWKGIDATLELAKSDNSKIVIIGAGPDGLPVILNFPEESPPASPPSGNQ